MALCATGAMLAFASAASTPHWVLLGVGWWIDTSSIEVIDREKGWYRFQQAYSGKHSPSYSDQIQALGMDELEVIDCATGELYVEDDRAKTVRKDLNKWPPEYRASVRRIVCNQSSNHTDRSDGRSSGAPSAVAQHAAIYQGLDGGLWKNTVSTDQAGRAWDMEGHNRDSHNFITVHGNQMMLYTIRDNPNGPTLKLNPHLVGTHEGADSVFTFESRQFKERSMTGYAPCVDGSQPDMEVTISQDGRTISTVQKCGTMTRATASYKRIR